jgi:hypothetical protein
MLHMLQVANNHVNPRDHQLIKLELRCNQAANIPCMQQAVRGRVAL